MEELLLCKTYFGKRRGDCKATYKCSRGRLLGWLWGALLWCSTLPFIRVLVCWARAVTPPLSGTNQSVAVWVSSSANSVVHISLPWWWSSWCGSRCWKGRNTRSRIFHGSRQSETGRRRWTTTAVLLQQGWIHFYYYCCWLMDDMEYWVLCFGWRNVSQRMEQEKSPAMDRDGGV